jgi:hypothetical protein
MFADGGGHHRISGRLGREPPEDVRERSRRGRSRRSRRAAGGKDEGTAIRSAFGQPGESDAARLADELAAALRAIRGYVPHRIWWEAGPAHALIAYQALQAM